MKVIVVGSGLIGVTTAYFLNRRGHEVTVIDRQEGAGRETSFANGGFLSASMPEPWNTPGCWRVLLRSLAHSEAPLRLRLKALPTLIDWGITFLRNSKRTDFERNTLSNARLALYSLAMMKVLREATRIEYGGQVCGAMKLFRSSAAMDRAHTEVSRLSSEGVSFQRLSPQEAVEIEPALAPIVDQLTGAIHYVVDEIGDAYRFCTALAQQVRKRGAEFCFETTVSGFEVRSGTVTAVQTTAGRLEADQYVLAAGSYSPRLVRLLGIRLPVRPAKGYSVTFESNSTPLQMPLVDDELHAAVVPLACGLRVAGTAEFAGFDLTLRAERVRNLIDLAERLLPRARLDARTAKPWCGLRPMSADGVPLVGPAGIANLWVSTGHGHLGWTQAAGSAAMLTDLICGDSPSIDPAPYAPTRFAGSNRT